MSDKSEREEALVRTEMLLGHTAMERLQSSHVAVFGLGGVGGYAAEALLRSGIGELTLVDSDTVSVSNLNRQIAALRSTVGQPKAEALAARFRDIRPEAVLHPMEQRYEAESRELFFAHRFDYIVDAIDLVSCKLDLIETAYLRKIPLLSAMGTGNKRDPSQLRIGDISETYGCPLARVMRRELRRRGITRQRVLYSPEPAGTPFFTETPPPGRRSVPSSAVWVTGCAGLMMAGEVVRCLTEGITEEPVSR